MDTNRRSSIKRVIRCGLLAGAIYIVCWAAAILVEMLIIKKVFHFTGETSWWLYHRFFPGIAEISVAIILFRERRDKWWLSLLIAAALWRICIHFYPYFAIKYKYPDIDLSYAAFFYGYHGGWEAIQLAMTLCIFGIMCFVSYKWKQGFEQ